MLYQPFTLRKEERARENAECERLAVYLADRLDDWKSYRFFLKVARTVPHETVRECLVRTLDIPRQEIRRSRGACFTGLVRGYLAQAESWPDS